MQYNAKQDIKVVVMTTRVIGFVVSLAGIYFTYSEMLEVSLQSFLSLRWTMTGPVMLFFGLLTLGLHKWIVFHYAEIKRIMMTGTSVQATIKDVIEVSTKNSSYYKVILKGDDPYTNEERSYKGTTSKKVDASVYVGTELPVYIDQRHPEKYVLDITSLS